MARRISPLNYNSRIVDEKGLPTSDFILLINELLKGQVEQNADDILGKLSDAPLDGILYGRRNPNWEEVLPRLNPSALGAMSIVNDGGGNLTLGTTRYANDSAAVAWQVKRARGTLAAPLAVLANDELLRMSARGQFDAATDVLLARFGFLFVGDLSTGNYSTAFTINTGRAGSTAVAEVLRAQYDTGISLYGVKVLDQNRNLILRNYTLALMATLVSGGTAATGNVIYVTNATGGAAPVYYDGVAMRRFSDNLAPNVARAPNIPVGGTTGQALVKTSGADYVIGWQTVGGGGGGAFSGATVTRSSALSIPIDGGVPWNSTLLDVGGYYNVSSPKRLTVPTGITKVRLSASLQSGSGGGEFYAEILKNGSSNYPGNPRNNADSSAGEYLILVTSVLPVVEGDYFEVGLYVATTRSLDTNSSFGIEGFS